jgi:hypothetical protein
LEHPLVVEQDAIKLDPEFAPRLNAKHSYHDR